MTAAETLFAVAFAGYGIVVVAGLSFTYYAVQNYAFDRLEGYDDFWGYLTYLGLAFAVFGALGLALTAGAGSVVRAFADVSLLVAIAFLTFALREVYFNSALAPSPDERAVSLERVRRLEFGFVVVVAVEWLVVVLIDQPAVAAGVKAVGALAFATYGVAFSERLESLAHGTVLDTLRRHLLLVLVCATGVAVADALALLAPAAVADGVFYVFLVLLGGLLVPPTVRLQQSVAGLT
ncbi:MULTISPECIES: hypothetical protein [Halobacterium]|uniref:hypothetical protein n=1 Tax=Halobacterium TaxID=2239 RepID=UPI00073F6F6F|nr:MULTISPECIES: hypothetical protein [Halobacterium]MCG1002910.1 hypothetical protein [Halobacterium noricense]